MTARRERENDEFFGFAKRILKASGARVAEGDTVDLAGLVKLREEFERIEVEAVAAMRERHGYSWAEIGRDLGITRQAAQQRYARRLNSRVS